MAKKKTRSVEEILCRKTAGNISLRGNNVEKNAKTSTLFSSATKRFSFENKRNSKKKSFFQTRVLVEEDKE